MIVSKDINPERDFYYLGGKVIEIMAAMEGDKIDFLDLFERINDIDNISINLYILTLDWLFIIGVIAIPEKGKVIKCF